MGGGVAPCWGQPSAGGALELGGSLRWGGRPPASVNQHLPLPTLPFGRGRGRGRGRGGSDRLLYSTPTPASSVTCSLQLTFSGSNLEFLQGQSWTHTAHPQTRFPTRESGWGRLRALQSPLQAGGPGTRCGVGTGVPLAGRSSGPGCGGSGGGREMVSFQRPPGLCGSSMFAFLLSASVVRVLPRETTGRGVLPAPPPCQTQLSSGAGSGSRNQTSQGDVAGWGTASLALQEPRAGVTEADVLGAWCGVGCTRPRGRGCRSE